jgi:hypothetical protein
VTFCDEAAWGFGWIQEERLARCSHVLSAEGRVWIFDPVDAPGVEARIRGLGEPAGVIQLLDRHRRDCAAFAGRLGVPHHVVPFQGVPGAPFDPVPVARHRFWREVALWWPEERVLLCGDALGTVGYFLARGERLGVHPLLRLLPPKALGRFAPRHVLCGHGDGIHCVEVARALEEALATARRRLPLLPLSLLLKEPRP